MTYFDSNGFTSGFENSLVDLTKGPLAEDLFEVINLTGVSQAVYLATEHLVLW